MADSFNRQIKGSQAVLDVFRTLGQPASLPIAGNLNPKIAQMWQFATDVGRELAFENWASLRQEFTLTLDGSLTYALPADFNGFIGSSAWDRTNQYPVVGDVGEPVWQRLQAAGIVGTVNLIYRLRNNELEFIVEPGPHTVVLPYYSLGWVVSGDPGLVGEKRDNLAHDDDVVLLEPNLFKHALKLKWLRENKFDTAAAQVDYDRALERAKSRDSTSRVISLRPSRGEPTFISMGNVADTGYGS